MDERLDGLPVGSVPAREAWSRGPQRFAIVWLVLGVLGLLLYDPIFYWISYAYVLVILGWAVAGGALFVTVLTRVTGSKARLDVVAALVIVPLFFATVAIFNVPLRSLGDRMFTRLHFAIQHAHYDDVVEDAVRDQPECGVTEWGKTCTTESGTRYRYDPGPPPRIAIPRPGGPAENWLGVIHDPSDGLADHTTRRNVTDLFGTAVGSCESLGDHYYQCRVK